MVGIAYAMGQSGAAGGAQAGPNPIFLIIIMFAIFYFLIFRPQQKKQKEHQEMINNLKKGDRVITGGGIHGRIVSVDESTVSVEIADRVRVKVNRGSVAAMVQSTKAQPEKESKTETGKLKSK
ncbi:MAG: preprotein translocase subunit YajC [Desulfobacteraceae bacterium]|nr:preprotein translocase subunit YajC [Desulfobacteraceae bacterium]